MRIHSTKNRDMVICWFIQFGIGCGILFIIVQLIDIVKMLIWGV
jgi:hypothetical protein